MKVDAYVVKHPTMSIELDALKQLIDTASLPHIFKHIVSTPDIHKGFGCPIGTVIASKQIVVPAAVGYDINCGVRLMLLPLPIKEVEKRSETLLSRIWREIPAGEGEENIQVDEFTLKEVCEKGLRFSSYSSTSWFKKYTSFIEPEELDWRVDADESSSTLSAADFKRVSYRAIERGSSQLATLGGGNHFIEIGYIKEVFNISGDLKRWASEFFTPEKELTYIMIHSGSRGFGHQIGDDYMKPAKSMRKREGILPNQGLGFFYKSEDWYEAYLGAMACAANFAYVNRALMGAIIRKIFVETLGVEPILVRDISHNIARFEKFGKQTVLVHRKGAVSARKGKIVLLPGSMGTNSFVLLGEEEKHASLTFFSSAHGAGRVMGRREAAGKRGRPGKVSWEEFEKSMEGIKWKTKSKRSALEEAPMCYKDVNLVVETTEKAGIASRALELKPKLVIKG